MSSFPFSNDTKHPPSLKFDQYYMGASVQPLPSHMSFRPSPQNTSKVPQQTNKLSPKLETVCEQVYELMMMKEGVVRMLREQKLKMADMMRELKRYLFQLDMKAQRDASQKESQSAGSSCIQLPEASSEKELALERELDSLRAENDELKYKYEQMLRHYRSQIDQLSESIVPPQHNQDTPATKEENIHLRRQLRQCQDKMKEDQQKYVDKIKYLQDAIIEFEGEYSRQKATFQSTLQQYKEKEKHMTFMEAEIQRKNVLLIEREKAISERQVVQRQNMAQLDRRQAKVSDFQHNQLRRQKNLNTQSRQSLRNEYYHGPGKLAESRHLNRYATQADRFSERESSSGKGQLVNSRIDVNARLKQIQLQRNQRGGGVKGSRFSEAGGGKYQRQASRSKGIGVGGIPMPRKDVAVPDVNHKLTTMLDSLQRDLHDIK